MTTRPYPHLTQLLGAYFHQDCYDDGDDDAAILADFAGTTAADFVAATASEIDSFLAAHPKGLLDALTATFQPDVILGETDAEVRTWLENAARALRQGR